LIRRTGRRACAVAELDGARRTPALARRGVQGLARGAASRYAASVARHLPAGAPALAGLWVERLAARALGHQRPPQRLLPPGQAHTFSSPRLTQFLEQHWESLRHLRLKRLQSSSTKAAPGTKVVSALPTSTPPSNRSALPLERRSAAPRPQVLVRYFS
jgi:hypothetical protein